jgi:hypothetical protein
MELLNTTEHKDGEIGVPVRILCDFCARFGVVETKDVIHIANAQSFELCEQGLAVINHMIRAQRTAPFNGFLPRCRGYDRQTRHVPGNLNRNRTNAASAADDQNAAVVVLRLFLRRDVQPSNKAS